MTYLAANIKRLQLHDANFALDASVGEIPVLFAKNGEITCMIPNTGQYVHSQYNSGKEAGQFADGIQSMDRLVAVYGFGLGYHIEQILNKLGRESVLQVFEGMPSLLKTALSVRDLPWLSDPRLRLIVKHQDDREWILSFAQVFEWLQQEDGKLLVHGPSLNGVSDTFPEFKKVLLEWKAKTQNAEYRQMMTNNLKFHRLFIDQVPNVSDLFGRFEQTPRVLVAAGPSLDANGRLLTLAKGKALIMAVLRCDFAPVIRRRDMAEGLSVPV